MSCIYEDEDRLKFIIEENKSLDIFSRGFQMSRIVVLRQVISVKMIPENKQV
jgi:hypothetical protein